jgi:hypothetical protein
MVSRDAAGMPMRGHERTRGRIKLEAKDRAKARLGRSPDIADAALLALHGSSTDQGRGFALIGGRMIDRSTWETVGSIAW